MNVMGLYPGDPGPLGAECAGEIVAVGEGINHFAIGDAVVAIAPASFAGYVTTTRGVGGGKAGSDEFRRSCHRAGSVHYRAFHLESSGKDPGGRSGADSRGRRAASGWRR